MPSEPVREALLACRTTAAGGNLTRMPRADLHTLVSRCMEIAERCERDPSEAEELHKIVRVDGVGASGRRYVEEATDSFLLVCRYVFDHDRSRGWRYAAVMREAAKRQIRSAALPGWLADNGGMNALFLVRPLDRKTVTTKVVRLSEPVVMPKHGTVVLTLQRNADGTFMPLANRPVTEIPHVE